MTRRRPPKGVDPVSGLRTAIGNFQCACGKMAFLTRKAAKAMARRRHPGDQMQAYRCDRSPIESWHFGHPRGDERTAS